MFPLDFDGSILDGTTGAALLLQLFSQGFEIAGGQWKSGDDRYPLTLAPFGFPRDLNLAVLARDLFI